MKCKNCGQCCYLGGVIPCRYLRHNKDGTTFCSIYKNRLGKLTGYWKHQPQYCRLRKEVNVDFVGCPYNSGKPIQKFSPRAPLSKDN
jgi:hypothetical protein